MYFAVEGVIGVGKTTLARLLQPAFEANLLLEVFEENPFLSNFMPTGLCMLFKPRCFFCYPVTVSKTRRFRSC